MSNNGFTPSINTAQRLQDADARVFAEQALRSVEAQGVRRDHVGIKAMCLLSGLDPEVPAVMPTDQAMGIVNKLRSDGSATHNNQIKSKSSSRSPRRSRK